jgi:hypothetical protein
MEDTMAEKVDSFARAVGIFSDVLDDTDSPGLDSEATPLDPVGAHFELAKFGLELEKSGSVIDSTWDTWDEPTTAPLEKGFTNPLNFRKDSIGYKLGITRQERKVDADGDVWIYAYDSTNELVDARVVNPFV